MVEKEQTKNLKDAQNKTTIKVSQELRGKLAEIGNKDETFEDVIWRLIRRAEPERSGEVVTSKSSVIQYKRKKEFVELTPGVLEKNVKVGLGKKANLMDFTQEVGFEYEYNIPPKKEGEWELDIKIIRIYYSHQTYNPSEFFGVDDENKYFSTEFLKIYFKILGEILIKDFGITKLKNYSENQLLEILEWKKVYYENRLSDESFINDVEEVLRKYSGKQIDAKIKKEISASVIGH